MVLTLDGRGPRYAQITRALVTLIRRGVLAPGVRAPSTRELARDIGCSRNVVLLAYEQLRLEGYLVGRARTGTFVAPGLSDRDEAGAAVARAPMHGGLAGTRLATPVTGVRLSRSGRRLTRAAARAMTAIRHRPTCAIDFMYGLAEPDDRLLRRLRAALLEPLRERAFFPDAAQGDPFLRQQIASRLRSTRGIECAADQIVITTGTQQAVDLCARLLVSTGDLVIVEDPGYDFATAALLSAGARVTYSRVDRDGLNPAALSGRRQRARLVYVTPSHQFPTGAVMPAARRHALVAWARRTRAFVFEDDYDGEFRYAGQPIPALAGLDGEVVIYCGTFSKSLFPAWRLGYLVLPAALVRPIVQCKWVTDQATSRLTQRALAHLLAMGDFDRHIRRRQRLYRERRDVLVGSLRRHLGLDVEIEGSSAGLHLAAWLPNLSPGRLHGLIEGCRNRDVGIYPLARHAERPLDRAALLLGYGVVDARQIERGICVVADEYEKLLGKRPGEVSVC